MTPVYVEDSRTLVHAPRPVLPLDDTRGTYGMLLLIATESMLFVMLFFSYYFVEKGNVRWEVNEPPHLHYALPQLGVLALACGVLWWGQKKAARRNHLSARLALLGGIILGLGYIVLSYFDYAERLPHLNQHSYAYGSIFYTITTIHGGHLALGILMLVWLLLMPRWEPMLRPPHRPYYNVLLYWYFLFWLWVATLAILYIGPNVYNAL
jgi:cytochrome c oxidase subunit 3